MIKKIFILLFGFGVLFFRFPETVSANEYIESFDSVIKVNQDTSLSIEESIMYFTDSPKHGIFRYIPYLLRSDKDIKFTRISDVSIVDESGKSLEYSKTMSNEFVEFKIGDPDSTFQGKKFYLISYKVSQALDKRLDSDELYWDITGEGWNFPIKKSSATVLSPFASISNIDCFTGAIGSNDGACNFSIDSDEVARFTYDNWIGYGKNFTIAINFARDNSLKYPKFQSIFRIDSINNLARFLAIFPILIMFLIWYRSGRDYVFLSPNVFSKDENQPQRKKRLLERLRVPFVYEPLLISPGEAGVMLHEKAGGNEVVAEIIELARKKFILISAVPKTSIFGKDDYKLIKTKSPTGTLTSAQQYLYSHLFATQDEITFSKLKGSFYLHFERTKKILEDSVASNHFFTNSITKARSVGIVLSIVLTSVVGAFVVVLCFLSLNFYALVLLGIGLPISLIFGHNLVQKTALGTNMLLQAKGLKKTLQLAKWRDEIKEKNLFIEAIIPYSISLGVIDKLSKDMDELGLKPPEYINHGIIQGASLHSFTKGFSSEASSSLSFNPSSSSRSSGSGFSGGSSGGGGGGGGGGSW